VLATLYTQNEASLKAAQKKFLSAIELSDEQPQEIPLIYKVVR
jgi:thymidine phosphorylase